MQEELLAHIKNKGDNAQSDIPAGRMTQEQISSRRRTTINNAAERQMFGIVSNSYKNKIKNK